MKLQTGLEILGYGVHLSVLR